MPRQAAGDVVLVTEITQESISELQCWCYEQHLVANDSCNDRILDGFDISQYADKLLLLGIFERDGARPVLPAAVC